MNNVHYRIKPRKKVESQHLDFVRNSFYSEWLKMQSVVTQRAPEPELYEKLKDCLKWLKQQFDWYLAEGEVEILCNKYNWVAESVNKHLELEEDKKIPTFKF